MSERLRKPACSAVSVGKHTMAQRNFSERVKRPRELGITPPGFGQYLKEKEKEGKEN